MRPEPEHADGRTSRLPLPRFEAARSADPDEFRTTSARYLKSHTLTLRGRNGPPLDAQLNVARLTDTALMAIGYGTDSDVDPGELDFYTLQIPLSGLTTFTCGRRSFVATTTRAALVSPTLALRMRLNAECVQFVYRIERVALTRHLAARLDARPRRPLIFQPEVDLTTGLGRTLAHLIGALASDVERGGEPGSTAPLAVRALEDTLMTALLAAPNNYSDQLAVEPRPASAHVARQAMALIAAHPERHHTLGDLAHAVHVSVRSLERAFPHHLGMTFTELLTDIRLRQLHAELRLADPATTRVSDVIHRTGLRPDGRLFAHYRRHFGETPYNTLGVHNPRKLAGSAVFHQLGRLWP